MPFQYNPHSLVKIWLSKNPDVFMNFENQTRLIDMRFNNPTARIHLMYDSTLLSDTALRELKTFCHEHDIIPVDADAFNLDELSEDEQELYQFYKAELAYVNSGGNLAVASDILRLMSPTYHLGTYTDLDAPVYSHHLPETVEVDSPLLLNIGSLKLLGSTEIVYAVNELVGVVDEDAAKPYLQKIHRGILSQLREFKTDLLEKSLNDFTSYNFVKRIIKHMVDSRPDVSYIEKSNNLTPPDGIRTSLNLRNYIHEVTNDTVKYLDFHRQEDESDNDVIQRLRNEIGGNVGISQWLFARGQYNSCKQLLALDDAEFLKEMMKRERSLYLLYNVLCTTGPLQITNSLFNSMVASSEQLDIQAKPLAFLDNGLSSAFATSIRIPLHATLIDIMHLLNNNVGVFSDASWLKEGRNLIKEREVGMRERQAELKTSLADELAQAKHNLESQLNTLEKRQNSWMGYFFHDSREAEINALRSTLGCFQTDKNVFDIMQYQALLPTFNLEKKSFWDRIFPSHTTPLLRDLQQLGREAVILSVTKDKMPSFATETNISTALTKLSSSAPSQIESRSIQPIALSNSKVALASSAPVQQQELEKVSEEALSSSFGIK